MALVKRVFTIICKNKRGRAIGKHVVVMVVIDYCGIGEKERRERIVGAGGVMIPRVGSLATLHSAITETLFSALLFYSQITVF